MPRGTVERNLTSSAPVEKGSFSQLTSVEATKIREAMTNLGIIPKDLKGAKISTKPPKDVNYSKDESKSHFVSKIVRRFLPDTVRRSAGCYSYEIKTIHLPPGLVLEGKTHGKAGEHLLTTVLAHELGHHMHSLHRQAGRSYYGSVSNVMKALKGKKESTLREVYGLRPYSLTSAEEMYADSFMVMKLGSPEQRRELESLYKKAFLNLEDRKAELEGWRKSGRYGLGSWYKVPHEIEKFEDLLEDGDTIDVLEIQTVEDGDLIHTVLVPVTITVAQYKATPWYYVRKEK